MMKEHEMHKRRFARNVVTGGLLFAFVALIFVVSVVKFLGQAG